uniref:Uncharacterized protein n=1 Tax=Solanum tuberosum TaxID=4113 RepID=M1DT96_SOLTU
MKSEKLQVLKLQAFSKLKLQLNALTSKFKFYADLGENEGIYRCNGDLINLRVPLCIDEEDRLMTKLSSSISGQTITGIKAGKRTGPDQQDRFYRNRSSLPETGLTGTGFTGNIQRFRPVP